ncbi:hypothetical protein WICPIJ_004738 [Wickerhamomyces pijperi]|uniref:Uncharacterized protein n=1 Tax=Wickerhamomyces pijperi TaxID=599730 RepID=A0A9P8Q4Y2_WICPI|nr:hypothetical protein WICPIJ_004738 [Wickerhamomyces pijperi]
MFLGLKLRFSKYPKSSEGYAFLIWEFSALTHWRNILGYKISRESKISFNPFVLVNISENPFSPNQVPLNNVENTN